MKDPYQRISCNLYDQLEAYATQGLELQLSFLDEDNNTLSSRIKIKTLETKDKAEYLITDSDKKIRLDKIVSISPVEA